MLKLFKDFLSKKLLIKVDITYMMPKKDGIELRENTVIRTTEHSFKQSDYRFMEYTVNDGSGRTYFYYEKFNNGHWNRVDGTWQNNPSQSHQAFLKLCENPDFFKCKNETKVIFEGLSEDETKTWAAMNV
jgi:hypothetical protein